MTHARVDTILTVDIILMAIIINTTRAFVVWIIPGRRGAIIGRGRGQKPNHHPCCVLMSSQQQQRSIRNSSMAAASGGTNLGRKHWKGSLQSIYLLE